MTGPTLYSMTAFAREQRRDGTAEAICELRSVNHRYLDIGLHLPEGLGVVETPVRARLTQALGRGKVDCHVTVRAPAFARALVVDTALVTAVVDAAATLQGVHPGLAPLATVDVLRWPGVVGSASTSGCAALALAAVDAAVDALTTERAREGARLAQILRARLGEVAALVTQLQSRAPAVVVALRERLRARIAALGVSVDPGRLEQELVIWVQRSDVAEELDRLIVHGDAVEAALAHGGAVGRRLDFLMQELHREANTLAAKSPSGEFTAAAVALKVLIEQMREQVQNLE
ncbi:MAG: YicC/YloC family endoribonuclease [Acidiferrobacter sp.]